MRLLPMLFAALLTMATSGFAAPELSSPNILFIIADDASRHYGEAYGCDWVKTPHIDRLAKAGLVFDNAYAPTSKCAPSRAAIMTGRNPWQLEDAANHQPYFPAKFMVFSEALAEAGVYCGSAGKTWGPGEAKTADGQPRSFGLGNAAGTKGGANPGAGLAAFLKARPQGKPFFYWFGSSNPHRGYKPDSGIDAGKRPSDIDHVPAYWPDNDIVRRDMLDYAIEVEAFDTQVGSLVDALEASGEAANTLVIVTSDHGMPFPRVKGHTFDDAHRIPFIASWPTGISQPARRVTDMISFIDLAPTFLDLLGVDGEQSGMSPITGHSFTDLLKDEASRDRSFVIVGRERNDVLCRPGTPAGLGYPARAIREGDFFYVQNFASDRWPCGDPDIGFKDTDASPTKKLAEDAGPSDVYWQHAFGKRPGEQLFDVVKDPDCVNNLAADPAFTAQAAALRDKLFTELEKQQDPRVLGNGDVFDNYLSPRAKPAAAAPTKKNAKKAKQ